MIKPVILSLQEFVELVASKGDAKSLIGTSFNLTHINIGLNALSVTKGLKFDPSVHDVRTIDMHVTQDDVVRFTTNVLYATAASRKQYKKNFDRGFFLLPDWRTFMLQTVAAIDGGEDLLSQVFGPQFAMMTAEEYERTYSSERMMDVITSFSDICKEIFIVQISTPLSSIELQKLHLRLAELTSDHSAIQNQLFTDIATQDSYKINPDSKSTKKNKKKRNTTFSSSDDIEASLEQSLPYEAENAALLESVTSLLRNKLLVPRTFSVDDDLMTASDGTSKSGMGVEYLTTIADKQRSVRDGISYFKFLRLSRFYKENLALSGNRQIFINLVGPQLLPVSGAKSWELKGLEQDITENFALRILHKMGAVEVECRIPFISALETGVVDGNTAIIAANSAMKDVENKKIFEGAPFNVLLHVPHDGLIIWDEGRKVLSFKDSPIMGEDAVFQTVHSRLETLKTLKKKDINDPRNTESNRSVSKSLGYSILEGRSLINDLDALDMRSPEGSTGCRFLPSFYCYAGSDTKVILLSLMDLLMLIISQHATQRIGTRTTVQKISFQELTDLMKIQSERVMKIAQLELSL